MIKKPDDIIYGLMDRPPPAKALLLGGQQVLVTILYLVLISFLAHKAHLSSVQSLHMMSMTLIAMAISVLLQVIWRGPVGSGYLISACAAPTYLVPAIAALALGGVPMMLGMICFSGAIEIVFALISHRLRRFFPRVVTGLIFCFLGLTIGILSLEKIFGSGLLPSNPTLHRECVAFLVTISAIIFLNVWAKGIFRLLCVMLGILIGALSAYFMGLFSAELLKNWQEVTWLAWPGLPSIHLSFSLSLVPLYLVTALACALRTMGVVTTAQQINDANWRSPEIKTIKGGVIADGLSALCSGLLGTLAVGASPSAVGITKATGATSRIIAFLVAGICLVLAFLPKVTAFVLLLPFPVVSAGLTFVSALMIVGGLRIIVSQPITSRRAIVIGLSLLMALLPKLFPSFFQALPGFWHTMTGSIMVCGTVVAVFLNLIFQIGLREKVNFIFEAGANEKNANIVLKQLEKWQIEESLKTAITQSLSALYHRIQLGKHANDAVKIKLDYNETFLCVQLFYLGTLPDLPVSPALLEADLVEDNVFLAGLRSLYQDVAPEKINVMVANGQVDLRLTFFVG